jgi:hypothetical protein
VLLGVYLICIASGACILISTIPVWHIWPLLSIGNMHYFSVIPMGWEWGRPVPGRIPIPIDMKRTIPCQAVHSEGSIVLTVSSGWRHADIFRAHTHLWLTASKHTDSAGSLHAEGFQGYALGWLTAHWGDPDSQPWMAGRTLRGYVVILSAGSPHTGVDSWPAESFLTSQ